MHNLLRGNHLQDRKIKTTKTWVEELVLELVQKKRVKVHIKFILMHQYDISFFLIDYIITVSSI